MSLTGEVRHRYSGKVRDLYETEDGLLLFVASDRLSAFDVVMAEPIADKGRVLTALTVFWTSLLTDLAPTHLVSVVDTPPVGVTGLARHHAEDLVGRALLVKPAEMLPLECIVRGYVSGLGVEGVPAEAGTVHGEPAPAGLRESDRLPSPVFTPSTKAAEGHDENISFAAAAVTGRRGRGGGGARPLPRRLRPGRQVGRGAGDHHRRHQVRARVDRR